MKIRPVIGITGNERPFPDDPDANMSYAATGFVEAVKEAGGIPLILPIGDVALAKDYISMIDKLIITGGQNVLPKFYGEEITIDSDDYLLKRDLFELALIEEARAAKKAIFTVCRGTQLYNVALGGTLHQDIEHHWQYMQRFGHFRGAAIMAAISAIDVALYDIAGKYFQVPVYRLLGGKCRDKVRVYNHTAGQTEEQLVENAIRGKEEGFTALGHLNPYLDEPRDLPFHDNNTQMLYNAERRIGKVREAVGEDIDLCLEMHRRLEPGLAVQLSRRLEKYNPMFLEDPVRPDNYDEMARVAAKTSIPIATGERITSFFDFAMLLERGACSYVRMSLAAQKKLRH